LSPVKISESLDQFTGNWSNSLRKLSEILTGNKYLIRAKGRDPIPKKHFEALSELSDLLQEWVDTHCKKKINGNN